MRSLAGGRTSAWAAPTRPPRGRGGDLRLGGCLALQMGVASTEGRIPRRASYTCEGVRECTVEKGTI